MSNYWIEDLAIDRVEKVKIGSMMTEFHRAEQLKQSAIDGLKAKLGVVLAPFFARDASIEAICLPGYTPGFNDGDECVYDIYTYSLQYRLLLPDGSKLNWKPLNGMDEEEYSLVEAAMAEHTGSVIPSLEVLTNDSEKVAGILAKFPLELWKSFGEGLYVIDRNGTVTVEFYDHE